MLWEPHRFNPRLNRYRAAPVSPRVRAESSKSLWGRCTDWGPTEFHVTAWATESQNSASLTTNAKRLRRFEPLRPSATPHTGPAAVAE
jgi:hypothetical protein